MTGTIFDIIKQDPSPGKKGYMELASGAPEPKDSSFLSSVADYAKTFLKGAIEGTTRLGHMMGPLEDYSGKSKQQELGEQTETLNELLPTEDTFGQRGLRRGLQQAPSIMGFPGAAIQALPRALIGGFLGEGAKDLGAPEWAQTALELTALMGPDMTKKLIEKGNNKAIIQKAREFGLSDEAITPLIQSEFKQKWLSKLSPRRGSVQRSLNKSKNELSGVYENIQKAESAIPEIETGAGIKFIDQVEDKLLKMPSGVRSKIKEDLEDLYKKGPLNGDNLINFWMDVNHEMGPKAKQLSLLKDPVRDALKEVSPELAKNFETINSLFSKYFTISKRLEPNLMTDLIGAGEALGLLSSLALGYYPKLLFFAGEKGARKIAGEMLTNPKFQQLGHKFVDAVKQNKVAVIKKISDLYSHLLKKISPETSNELSNLSVEDFEKYFSPQKKSKAQK